MTQPVADPTPPKATSPALAAAAAPARWRRWDRLFVRVLLAQALTATLVTGLFGAMFYVERNLTVARLLGERWLPALRAASGLAPLGLETAGTGGLAEADLHPPPQALPGLMGGPRVVQLKEALRAGGLQVLDVQLVVGQPPPQIWIAVPGPDGQPRWRVFSDDLVESRLPLRGVLALLMGGLLVAGGSAWVARWLARPLESLRQRMDEHQPGAAEPQPLPPIAGATREMADIDRAWQAAQVRAAQFERERALLLAGVSHDLRSPLARIRMAAELLPEDDATVARRRELIVRNTEVADRLIASFLDHVRSQTLPMQDRVDLAALAQRVVLAQNQPLHRLSLVLPEGPLWLDGCNELLMERLLGNLIDNAFKHGAPPVRVRLAVEGSATGGAQIHLDVEDAGPGLLSEDPARLQEAFARGDRSRGTPGTGLGLAVVSQVARRLGGELSFETLATGCRARLRLPLGRASHPVVPAA